MAVSKIAGNIIDISHSTVSADDVCDVTVRFYVTGNVTGMVTGITVVLVDMSLNDTQVTTAIRTALAA